MPEGAIFHFDVGKTISAGYSLAASQYRERTGVYSERGGRATGGIIGWEGDAQSLWTAAEQADTPKRRTVEASSRPRVIARQITIALPDALSEEERIRLVKGFALHLRDKHGAAIQWDIHTPGPDGDKRNHHAHLMITTRRVDNNIFGKKTRELDDIKTRGSNIYEWREEWANRTNRALERAGIDIRVSHLSRANEQAQNPQKDVPPPNPKIPNIPYQRARKRNAIPEARKRATKATRKHRRSLESWNEVRDIITEINNAEFEAKHDTAPTTHQPVPTTTERQEHAPEARIMAPTAPTTTRPQKQPPSNTFHVGNKCFEAYAGAWVAYKNNDADTAGKHLRKCKNIPILEHVAATQKAVPNSTNQDWLNLFQWIITRANGEAKKMWVNYLAPLQQALMPKNRAPITKTTTPKKSPPLHNRHREIER